MQSKPCSDHASADSMQEVQISGLIMTGSKDSLYRRIKYTVKRKIEIILFRTAAARKIPINEGSKASCTPLCSFIDFRPALKIPKSPCPIILSNFAVQNQISRKPNRTPTSENATQQFVGCRMPRHDNRAKGISWPSCRQYMANCAVPELRYRDELLKSTVSQPQGR